jgi:tetratricopeptide (TPR) repeat protein
MDAKAIKNYSKAVELNLNDSDIYYNRVVSYYDTGNRKKAIQDYSKVISIKNDYVDAYYNRGLSYYYLKKWIWQSQITQPQSK